jgi:hypothetical protein
MGLAPDLTRDLAPDFAPDLARDLPLVFAGLATDLTRGASGLLRVFDKLFGFFAAGRAAIFFEGDFFSVFDRADAERRTAIWRLDEPILLGDFDAFAFAADRPEALPDDLPDDLEVETAFFGLDSARERFESLSLIDLSFKEAPAPAGTEMKQAHSRLKYFSL